MLKIKYKENDSYLLFGSKDVIISASLNQNEKQPILIINDLEVKKIYYNGFTILDNQRGIKFENIKLKSIFDLKYEDDKLNIIRKIAIAFKKAGSDFLALDFGILSLARIYFDEDLNILLLPKDLSDIISLHLEDEDFNLYFNKLVNYNLINSYALYALLSQLLYFSIINLFPYENESLREKGLKTIYRASFYLSDIDKKDDDLLFNDLCASLSYQRKICRSNRPLDNIDAWLKNYEDFKIPHSPIEPLTKEKLKKIESDERSAKRHKFLRLRGSLILAVSALVIILSSIVGWIIYNALKPPYTKDFNQVQIIQAYYDAQNQLDVQKLTASFDRKVKSPIETELVNLFVTYKMRQAYEGISSIIIPKDLPSTLPPGSFVYGNSDLNIQEVSKDVYRATYLYYSPKPSDEIKDYVDIQVRKIIDEFEITLSKRGYYLISKFKTIENKEYDTIRIPYKK